MRQMKVGDIIEARHGEHGLIIETEMMYPSHPESPVGRIKVSWFGQPPRWWRPNLAFSIMSLKRVVSRA